MEAKEKALQLKDLIAQNKQGEAIREMFEMLKSTEGDGANGLYVLLGRKNRLDEQIARGTISLENANLESNKITDTLLTYVDRIGKGKTVSFHLETYSKEGMEHDRVIFKESEYVIDFDNLNSITGNLTEYRTYKTSDKDKLIDFFNFLSHPDNEFVSAVISNKVKSLMILLDELTDFLEEEFEKKGMFSDTYELAYFSEDSKGSAKKNKELDSTLDKLATNTINAYRDFRSEVKRKLFI
ncbi:MAG: hypothetical protein IPN76_27105 [Saprospiraceae bacterium]|nr:hypothetical protein [Saprospiraceae bacterium]